MNYARRQQYRRLFRAGEAAVGGAIVALLGLVAATASAAYIAAGLLLTGIAFGLYSRHWLSLARRSRIGARSEDQVQGALAPLKAEGWRLRHSLPWQGRGDIDSVALAPTGIAVAIETKTKTYDRSHLARVREQAAWLARRRRRWARDGAAPPVLPVVVMTIFGCPTCNARNRVGPIAHGVPRCPRCKSTLPWVVDAGTDTSVPRRPPPCPWWWISGRRSAGPVG